MAKGDALRVDVDVVKDKVYLVMGSGGMDKLPPAALQANLDDVISRVETAEVEQLNRKSNIRDNLKLLGLDPNLQRFFPPSTSGLPPPSVAPPPPVPGTPGGVPVINLQGERVE